MELGSGCKGEVVMGGESRLFFSRRLLAVPLRGRVWGTVVPQVVGSNHITYFAGWCCGEDFSLDKDGTGGRHVAQELSPFITS